jgi:hypothetical protein
MTELNSSGGSGGSYLFDEQTIKLHILNSVYIFCFEPNLVFRNIVLFWIGALAYVPNRAPNIFLRQTEEGKSKLTIQNGINMVVTAKITSPLAK